MKNKLLTLVLAIGLVNPVLASTKTFGNPDCGAWVNPASKYATLGNRAWLTGFLSGLNWDEYYKKALNKVSSAEQIFLWMDNYCKTNPLEKVGSGAKILMEELKKQ